jgi:hypothetical protein
MPEIAEGKSRLTLTTVATKLANIFISVARLVQFLRQHLVGKTIARVQALDDNNVFGKVGCSGPAFEKALKGRTVSCWTARSNRQVQCLNVIKF